ncbi:MAG: ABC-2 family transporter protein, partial [Treponemataceae bacterium]|nr:ABC-2 family transporter protein [Treponemataceae bacterium]
MNCVYENKKNILIFTGGKSPSTEKILSTLKNFKIDINSSFVICADSGLEIAQNCGIKVDFLLGLLGFFLTQIMGIAFLYLVFEQIPSLDGWTLDQLIFIYGFAQIPRGIDHLFTDNIWLVAWR